MGEAANSEVTLRRCLPTSHPTHGTYGTTRPSTSWYASSCCAVLHLHHLTLQGTDDSRPHISMTNEVGEDVCVLVQQDPGLRDLANRVMFMPKDCSVSWPRELRERAVCVWLKNKPQGHLLRLISDGQGSFPTRIKIVRDSQGLRLVSALSVRCEALHDSE